MYIYLHSQKTQLANMTHALHLRNGGTASSDATGSGLPQGATALRRMGTAFLVKHRKTMEHRLITVQSSTADVHHHLTLPWVTPAAV